ncbi:hypothetical protein [Glycomyces sp. NRRL B-16210]|uniref:hypothetical protein n=1 Tax=Glycomyces sp. NRRL B-16210 TaxID=1463821 RepID=UPI0004C2AA4E|nr:hypothetical protein [Glycomyces sp. NRRL B-16210]
MNTNEPRRVTLRSERTPTSSHSMWAYVDDDGALHVDGHDLDPALESFVGKDEAETFKTVKAEHLGALVELLGGEPGADVLDLLAERYTGPGSYELNRILGSGAVPVERLVL